jgi:hypothetical protein
MYSNDVHYRLLIKGDKLIVRHGADVCWVCIFLVGLDHMGNYREREREREREDLMVVKLNININFVPKKKFPRPSASLFQRHGLNNLF